jgi:DNA-binding ferritin-like protein (Dps family)
MTPDIPQSMFNRHPWTEVKWLLADSKAFGDQMRGCFLTHDPVHAHHAIPAWLWSLWNVLPMQYMDDGGLAEITELCVDESRDARTAWMRARALLTEIEMRAPEQADLMGDDAATWFERFVNEKFKSGWRDTISSEDAA